MLLNAKFESAFESSSEVQISPNRRLATNQKCQHYDMPAQQAPYVLGYTPEELKRLGTQASVINPIFQRTLEEAGVSKGMRVLDVACGPGYVSTMLAEMVGPDGEVVGVDISETAIAAATARVNDLGLKNVTFHVGDPSKMEFDQPFDAVVGRYILMFLADPVAMLRGVARHARKGGIVAFHEVDWYSAKSFPPAPLYDSVVRWLTNAVAHGHADCNMGLKLPATFVNAGLPAPNMRTESLIGSGASIEPTRLVVELLHTLQDSVVASGAATKEEIGIDTLADRVRAELLAKQSTAACRSEIGAWVKL